MLSPESVKTAFYRNYIEGINKLQRIARKRHGNAALRTTHNYIHAQKKIIFEPVLLRNYAHLETDLWVGVSMAKRILIVDDDEKILRIFNLLITSFGYTPVLVSDPAKGLEVLQDDPPALILLDLMMSPMSGLEFLEERKKIPGASDVPVVILSALRLNDEEFAPYANSVSEVAIKPIEPAQLKEIIARHVS